MVASIHPGLIEHTMIDRAFADALGALASGTSVLRPFRSLARLLHAHLDAEDDDLDAFATIDPAESAELKRQHQQLRVTLAVLSEAATAGSLAARDLLAFRLRFTIHEAREETTFYRRICSR